MALRPNYSLLRHYLEMRVHFSVDYPFGLTQVEFVQVRQRFQSLINDIHVTIIKTKCRVSVRYKGVSKEQLTLVGERYIAAG